MNMKIHRFFGNWSLILITLALLGINVAATVTHIPPYVGPVTLTYPGAGTVLPAGVSVAGRTSYTFNLGAGPPTVPRQFIPVAGDNAAGSKFPSAEVRTGPAVPGAKTDTAPHIVMVQ